MANEEKQGLVVREEDAPAAEEETLSQELGGFQALALFGIIAVVALIVFAFPTPLNPAIHPPTEDGNLVEVLEDLGTEEAEAVVVDATEEATEEVAEAVVEEAAEAVVEEAVEAVAEETEEVVVEEATEEPIAEETEVVVEEAAVVEATEESVAEATEEVVVAEEEATEEPVAAATEEVVEEAAVVEEEATEEPIAEMTEEAVEEEATEEPVAEMTEEAVEAEVTEEPTEEAAAVEETAEGESELPGTVADAIAAGDPAAGQTIFSNTYNTSSGAWMCASCHSVDEAQARQVGPALWGLYERAEERAAESGDPNGVAYVHNSIVAPNAYHVTAEPDYPEGLMPANYSEVFTEQEITNLVAYLMTLGNPDAP